MSAIGRLAERLAPLPPATNRRIRVDRKLRIPMDDGATLIADHWMPALTAGQELASTPLVIVRTAYGRGGPLGWLYGPVLAERGVQVLMVSSRGTFGSDGEFLAMRHEREDGLATFRWLVGQPWAGEQWILAGSSYFGYTQWAVADAAPPQVRAMVPHITSARLALGLMRPNRLDLETIVGFSWNTAPQARGGRARPSAQEQRGYLVRSMVGADRRHVDKALKTLPIVDIDTALLGRGSQFFQEVVQHDQNDPYWAAEDRSATVPEVTVPVSAVTGWYDIFLTDQLRDFRALADAGRDPRLTVGPWWHADPRGMAVAAAEIVGWAADLAAGRQPAPRAAVKLWVMRADTWREFASWPPAGYVHKAWHLQQDGALGLATGQPGGSRIVYDPADPTPSLGGPKLNPSGAGAVDNGSVEAREDVLTFTSEPLPTNLEVVGEVDATVWVSSDRPATDLFVRLCDVDETGESVNVCDDLVHADVDGDTEVHVHLSPTAYLFKAGHRLRIQVAAGAFPRFARNLGFGDPLATGTRMQTTTLEVLHGTGHDSVIRIPVAE